MSLISCPECQHQVSDLASSCPSCGHPMRTHHQAIDQTRPVDEWGRAAGLVSAAWEMPRVRFALTALAVVAFLLMLFD